MYSSALYIEYRYLYRSFRQYRIPVFISKFQTISNTGIYIEVSDNIEYRYLYRSFRQYRIPVEVSDNIEYRYLYRSFRQYRIPVFIS